MKNISLLDCTLRDGGYVNDWEFGHSHLISIFDRLTAAGVDIIEVGFLDHHRPFDRNRSIFPDTESAGTIWSNITKRPPMVVGMIDYGSCDIDDLQPCSESFLDGIRVIFKKHIMHEAMDFCAKVKELGYRVFAQLVSVTSYNEDELQELIGLANSIQPYAVSLVDTYGLLRPNDLLRYYRILDRDLAPGIQIGFHAHNNLQLAFANALAFISEKGTHDVVVDATLYGMGKSAGNAPIELVARQLNDDFGKDYKISSLLEAIQESIMDTYLKSYWGYNMFFYLSAENRCHPNYVSFLHQKENLSVSKIDQLLSLVEPEEAKLLYDKKVAEQKYFDFLSCRVNDASAFERLGKNLEEKELVLIGPGKSILQQVNSVEDYIRQHNAFVISVNYIPGGIVPDCVFITNKRRYQQMADALHDENNLGILQIATTNVERIEGSFDYVFNREPLLEKKESISDNSFLMLLKILKRAGVRRVCCAGFDGYSEKEENYFNPSMEYYFIKNAARQLNNHMRDIIEEMQEDGFTVEFLTYSHYTEKEDSHDAAF